MTDKKAYIIRNKTTGLEYKLLKEECDKLVIEEPFNFEVIDKDYISPIPKASADTSTYNRVVLDDNPDNKITVKPLEKYSYDEIKKYCKDYGLSTEGKKDVLIARAIEHTKLLALRQKLEKITGKNATEEMTAEDIEKDIIDALTEKVKEQNIEIEQNPVTIEYLESLLSDNPEKVEE